MSISTEGNLKVYTRYCERRIVEALTDTPIVIISGPRQTGKTTLARQIRSENSIYITLDDSTQYDAAKNDPTGFIRNLEGKRIVIDEVQRVPELFLAIKQGVDENRIPGQYLLTGSSNVLLLPKLSDSLAGRMEIINLLPLTTCEIDGVPSTFIDKILHGEVPTSKLTRIREKLINKILRGGYPEPIAREQKRRVAWYLQYISNLIQKDLRDLGNLEHIDVMPRLVRLLATQVGQLIEYTEIANKLGISRPTVSHYLSLLKQMYIFETLPAWHTSDAKRLIKTPKIHIVDSGLLCALNRIDEQKIIIKPPIFGHLLENYVVNEIKRITTWHEEPFEFFYYRDKDKVEIDLILETYSGETIAIEIKASATVTSSDFNGLRKFKKLLEQSGKPFIMGIILYDGDHSTQHGDKLYSVPIGSLWE